MNTGLMILYARLIEDGVAVGVPVEVNCMVRNRYSEAAYKQLEAVRAELLRRAMEGWRVKPGAVYTIDLTYKFKDNA